MRKFFVYLAVLVFLFIFTTDVCAQHQERDWDWKPYATLMKGGKTFMILYYGTSIAGYKGTVRWKFINRSANPIYKIILNEQNFILNNGETVTFDKRKFSTRRVDPGGFAMTLITQIESLNLEGIKEVQLDKPEITLDFGKGRVYDWNKLGTIEMGFQ